jgi:GrpB-like predicted nucleotidyltransferase (UPF0157 family)
MSVRFRPEAMERDVYGLAWKEAVKELADLMPYAEFEHVGSTAVLGAWTNGELDVAVRVPKDKFAEADKALKGKLAASDERPRTKSFAMYKDEGRRLVVLLCEIDSEHDVAHRHRDRFMDQPLLRERYDGIKRRHQDVEVEKYRAAKDQFFKENPL